MGIVGANPKAKPAETEHFMKTNKEILQRHLSTMLALLECCNTCNVILGQTLDLQSVNAVGIYISIQICTSLR